MTMTISVSRPAFIDRDQLIAEITAMVGMAPSAGSVDSQRVTVTFAESVDHNSVIEAVGAHSPDRLAVIDALVDRAFQVWAGEATFTQAQAQKILAGLVLVVAKDLR